MEGSPLDGSILDGSPLDGPSLGGPRPPKPVVSPSALPVPRERGRGRALALALGVILAFTALLHVGAWGLDPTSRDQVHDMTLALRIREGTSLSDGNRHPLLPAALAPFASREPEFFPAAQRVAWAVTALSLLLLYLAVAGTFSAPLALLSLVLLLPEVRLQARVIGPEPLLAACLAVAAACFAASARGRAAGAWCFAAGAATGAAWLTKGTAMLSLAALLAATFVVHRGARLSRLSLALLGFVVVASPLLAWNVSQGRLPWFNVNSAHVMWEDRWDVDLDRRSTATISTWASSHTARDAFDRLAAGVRGQGRQRGMEWLAGYLAVVVVAGGIAALLHRSRAKSSNPPPSPDPGRRAWRMLATWSVLTWGLALAWYAPVVAARRLLFPIFPLLLPAALDVLARAGSLLLPGAFAAGRRIRSGLSREMVPLAAFLVVAALLTVGWAEAATTRPQVRPEFVEAARSLAALRPAGARVLVRPSRTFPPDWMVEGQVEYVALPSDVVDDAVPAWLVEHADYVLLTEGLVRNRPLAWGSAVRWDESRGIVGTDGGLPWGTLVWQDASPVRRYAILKVRRPGP